ncbi:disulfide bond formation protein DsbA [Arcobacter sp. CECT 8983]|uniref:DsbA family protein n=1 Tax=Arcobacter sp. CECT 8983 TaxID=2044508 RepID=UPI00100A98D5|nr:thioredoxin domain-containing protein [Arcobacter sp. CECT 8983]RXJ90752.1 disulfide bond formation protein DsbA [Arcobacter sp. CECT 8983]
MQNKKVVLVSIVALLALFFVAGYVYKNKQSEEYKNISENQALVFQRPYSIVIGNKDAKLQLVEFFDPACGTCAYFHPHVKEIMKEHEGKIKLVLRYAPFHQNSNYAVKMLEGAREQGMFMETLEFMFATQTYWIKNHVVQPKQLWALLANVKGLDMEKMTEFMNNNKTADERIAQDLKDAETLKADKTPSYFVNGKPLQEFGLENLKKLINSEL